jgi:DUF4097 and DUF4098 domain-containing protein YvlB
MVLWFLACVSSLAWADDRAFDRKVAAEPHGTVEISNVSGRIEVSGWDAPEVEVHADLGGGADRVDVTSERGRTIIKVIVPNNSFRTISTVLRVRVPRDSELDVSGVSADILATDVRGPMLQLKTVSGDVATDTFQGSAEVKTVSGNVVLHGRGPTSELRINTISGDVTVEHGSGDLEATTTSGRLNISLDGTRSVRVRTTSGDLDFRGKLTRGGSFDAESISGDVKVRLVPEAGYDYEVATFSGEIKSCMGGGTQSASRYGPGKRMNGTVGKSEGDNGRVRLKTMSGDVELCNRS